MWFTENAWQPAALFAAAGSAALFYALRTGLKSAYVLAAGAIAAAAGTVLLERLVVTEREVVEGRITELADTVVDGDVERAMGFFSPTAATEAAQVAMALAVVDVHDDLRITDGEVRLTAADSQAVTRFRANATITVARMGYESHQPTYWELVWRREGTAADATGWKIVEVRRLDPITGEATAFRGGRRR